MPNSRSHCFTHRQEDPPFIHVLEDGQVVVAYVGHPEAEGRCEDAALAVFAEGDRVLLAVADGMGSGPRGADASAAIVAALAEGASREGVSRASILDSIESADEEIRGWGIGSATTVIVAELAEGACRTFHVGDSEALVVGGRGRLKLRTVSHSPTGYLTAGGMLEDDDARVHADRHLVDCMLGLPGMRVDLGERLLLAPLDTLVLGTDGLFDNLLESEIVEVVRKGPLLDAANTLFALASSRMSNPESDSVGKPDDLTFILYRPARTAPKDDSR